MKNKLSQQFLLSCHISPESFLPWNRAPWKSCPALFLERCARSRWWSWWWWWRGEPWRVCYCDIDSDGGHDGDSEEQHLGDFVMIIATSLVITLMMSIMVADDSNIWKGPLEVPCGNFSIVIMIFCSPHQLQRHIHREFVNVSSAKSLRVWSLSLRIWRIAIFQFFCARYFLSYYKILMRRHLASKYSQICLCL